MSAPMKKHLIEIDFHLAQGMQRVTVPQKAAEAAIYFLKALSTGIEDESVDVAPFVREREQLAGGKTPLALRAYRVREGITQRELAKSAELFPSHLSLMENGKRSITPKVAKRLARVLKCGWTQLVFKKPR